jgi:hypothetical protein
MNTQTASIDQKVREEYPASRILVDTAKALAPGGIIIGTMSLANRDKLQRQEKMLLYTGATICEAIKDFAVYYLPAMKIIEYLH